MSKAGRVVRPTLVSSVTILKREAASVVKQALLVVAGTLLLAGCVTDPPEPVSSVELVLPDTVAPFTIILPVVHVLGASGQVLARNVILTTSDAAVAAITSDRRLQAGREGTVAITARADHVLATVMLTVRARVDSVAVLVSVDSLPGGQFLQLVAQPYDSAGRLLVGASYLPRVVTWRSLDTIRAVVLESGLLRGISGGLAPVEATIEGVSDLDTVRIMAAAASVSFTLPVDSLGPGDTLRLSAVLRDSAGQPLNRAITFGATDPPVVVVNGLATAMSEGVGRVVARAEGVTDTARLTVRFVVASVGISLPSDTLTMGDSMVLTATPRDHRSQAVPGRTVTWQSLDTTLATINAAGRLRSRLPGNAIVTATVNGVSARDTVRVLTRVDSVRITPAIPGVVVGDTLRLRASVLDIFQQEVSDHALSWRSSNPSVATVDSAGLVRGLALGSVTITALAGGRQGQTILRVTPNPPADVAAEWAVRYESFGYSYYYYSHPRCTGTASMTFTQQSSTLSGTLASEDPCDLYMALSGISGSVIERDLNLTSQSCTFTASANALPRPDTLSGGFSCNGSWFFGSWVATRAGAPASVEVRPSSNPLVIGAHQKLEGALKDGFGNRLHGRAWTWASTDQLVAVVDISGIVGGLQPGFTTISATSAGLVGQAAVSVTAMPLAAMAGGQEHTCGLTTAGAAYCWGLNVDSALGDGTVSSRTAAVQVNGGQSFVSLSAGSARTCGLTASGAAWCWGRVPGDGTQARSSPSQVAGNRTFTALGSGPGHSCGVTTSGEIWCWGENSFGQLGNGNTSVSQLSPVQVMGSQVFVAVTAGLYHTCALDNAGKAWCWGRNDAGQLGLGGTGGLTNIPTTVSGNRSYTAITAGNNHACALQASGQAWCWGSNQTGAVGDGSLAGMRDVPVAVAGSLTLTSIDVGGDTSCGVAVGGIVWCWGANGQGQLGDGSQTGRAAPTPVAGSFTFTAVSVGGAHSCGMASGIGYCWGGNTFGQLGIDVIDSYVIPRRVTGQP